MTITATSRVAGFREVILDLLDNMTVQSVTRGAAPLAFTHRDNLVRITLDRAFNAGQSFEIKVSYSGRPQSTGFGSIGWNKYFFTGQGKMVWTLSEPDGARTWWPCKDLPADKAAVEEWWTVPATWTATGNGTLIGTETLSGSRKRFKWKPARPLTTYLVSIAATDYASFSDTYTALDGTTTMPVTHYVYSEYLTRAQESFRNTPAMIAFYAQTFGEYPFLEDKYGMSAFPWSGAMEHTTNTSYGYTLIDGGHGNDYVIAHELAHQWWGDSVSPEDWKNVWLNEGFASYSEALWAEHLGGADRYRDYMNSFWRSSFDGTLYDPNDLFGSTVYDKGAWAVHMLRGVMGDGPFFLGLRDWYATRRDATGNTAQFQATMEARHGAPLGWYFQEWVYGPNMPAYEVGWTTADLGSGVVPELGADPADAGRTPARSRCRSASRSSPPPAASCGRSGTTRSTRTSRSTRRSRSPTCCSTSATGSSSRARRRSRWRMPMPTASPTATTTALRWPTRCSRTSTPTPGATPAMTTTTTTRWRTGWTAPRSIRRRGRRARSAG